MQDRKITAELWIKGNPEEVRKIIESLEEQGYDSVEAVCRSFGKKVVMLS